MFWLQSCPRCGGDLYSNRDHYGHYIACIQCGRYLTDAEEILLKCAAQPKPPADVRKAPASEAVGGVASAV